MKDCICKYYEYPRKIRGKTHAKDGHRFIEKVRRFKLGCPVHDKSLIRSGELQN